MLQGEWLSTANAECALGASFKGDRFTFSYVCVPSLGTARVDMVGGKFTVAGDQIATAVDVSSCPSGGLKNNGSGRFDVTGDKLTLYSATGGTTYSRSGGGPAVEQTVIVGCFDSKGDFQPMAAHPVP